MQRHPPEQLRQYMMRRLAQEQAAAERPSDARARDVHLELAQRYRDACGGRATRTNRT